jgi:hypothetical protein
MKAVESHGRAFLPEGGIGLRGPVAANDMKVAGCAQVLSEAMKEIDQPDIHLLRFSRPGVPENMIDPLEFVGTIIPGLPINGFKPFIRMGVEEREPLRGVRSGDFPKSGKGGRGNDAGQGGESTQPENPAAAHLGVKHFSSLLSFSPIFKRKE